MGAEETKDPSNPNLKGGLSEEEIEYCVVVLLAIAPVRIAHRYLVHVCEQRAH
jgi:hypothetical protein